MAGTYNPVTFRNGRVYLTTTTQDLSDHCQEIKLTREFDDHDDSRMGLTDHSHIAGLGKWSGSIKLIQEFASTGTNIDAILFPLVGGAAVTVAFRPVNAARGVDNPEYSGPAVFLAYDPMSGAVGDLLSTVVPFMGAGSLTRVTTSS